MSVNSWIGEGIANYVSFKVSDKGNLWLTLSLGIYDPLKKKRDYFSVQCFDKNIVEVLKPVLTDGDFIRVAGRLSSNKVDKTTYWNIVAENVFWCGKRINDGVTYEGSPKEEDTTPPTGDEVPF